MTYKCINNMHTKQHYMHLELAFLPSKQLHNNSIHACMYTLTLYVLGVGFLYHIYNNYTPTLHTNIHTIALYVLGVGFLGQFDINQWLFSLTPLTTIHRLHMHTSSQMYTHPHKCTHTSSQMHTHYSISQFDINQTHIRIKCT